MKFRFETSLVLRALSLLSRRDQLKVVIVVVVQIFLALFDLLSIALIGLIASLTLFGIQSKSPPQSIQDLIEVLNLDTFSFQSQVAILGAISGTLLVSKTLFSAVMSRRILYFLNLKTAVITAELLAKVLSKPYDYIKTKAPAEILFSLTRGVNSLVAGIIGVLSQISTEISLLLIVFLGLMFYDPIITIFCLLYFGLIAVVQTRRLKKTAELSQNESTKALMKSESQILESLNLYRELHVRGARAPKIEELVMTRSRMAQLQSRVLFMPYVTKYSMEIALVLGAMLLMAAQFLLKDALSALTTLSVFLVAASRVSPSLLRLQQSLIQFKAFAGESRRTVEMISDLAEYHVESKLNESHFENSDGEISLQDVSFSYRDSSELVIKKVTFNVKSGEMLALVGPSGHGKSTLMDLSMGALHPTSGSIHIDGLTPLQFIELNPGKLGYVAQESIFANTSVRENLLIGLDSKDFSDEMLWSALEKVGLKGLFESMPEQLDTSVGERGLRLSIGQKQRLSIARALLTDPKILFLDEPTSALDAESEQLISNLMKSLKGKATIVVIAHRLETIKSADRVLSIKNGAIEKQGSYGEVLG